MTTAPLLGRVSPPSRQPEDPVESRASSAVDYEDLFQQAPCGYLLTRDDGTITSVNDTFADWAGYKRADLVGMRLQNLLPVGDKILYATHCLPQLAMVGAIAEIAVDVIGGDGTRRAALLSAARHAGSDGSDATVRVIVFSAHERRAYEKELLAARRRAEASDARRADVEAELRHSVYHDPLTGLANRAGLTLYLEESLADNGHPGALFIDLDYFKAVDDSLGHAAGDELLNAVADRLQAAVRDSTMIARLSGDEFIVIDDFATAAQAGALAQRLLEALNMPVVIEGLEIVTSASVGATIADPAGDSPDRLLRRADLAMYQAKARGRNRWEFHHPEQEDPAIGRLRTLGELRHGIENGEMRLHYQPRINLRTGTLAGVEALVRWQHPVRGLLPPSEFIAGAEESGLIRELGAWVLNEGVAQAARWHHTAPHNPTIAMAVNLSARQLADSHLVEKVVAVLAHHQLHPSLLTLEITETAIMADPDAALTTLTALDNLGVAISIDDFGTGYASLTYLKRFPIKELKIDQTFVKGLTTDRGDAAIVASCVQLAHAVGLHAVAEGVETIDQQTALTNLGCDLVQGYLYSRPLPADALEKSYPQLRLDCPYR